jgi:4-hydroxybenzoate polyprenyltransferase
VTNLKPADALKQHWTDALPAAWKPYAQLSRLDRPIGWQLLLLPCWMGIAIARTGYGFFWSDLALALAFLAGAVAMRGAGCTYNDILDRDIDAKVERTRLRPLPSGAVSLNAAWMWLLAQCLIGLVVLLTLPRLAQIVALIAIPLVALYPLMKRITWWPQAWLGIVFSWGALTGAGAVAPPGGVPSEAIALYTGCICWTIGYDTIYALQDREDDALVGIRSSARRLGRHVKAGVGLFYAAAVGLWALAFWWLRADPIALLALMPFGTHMAWQVATLDPSEPANPLARFRANRFAGALMAAACLVVGNA